MPPLDAETMIGVAAFITSVLLFVPQARRTWEFRKDPDSLRGVSIGTSIVGLANALLWFSMAAVVGSFWVGAPGFLNVPLTVFTIFLLLKARRQQLEHAEPKLIQDMQRREAALREEGICPRCRITGPHKIFVVERPGYGSVVDCTGNPRPFGITVTTDEEIEELVSAMRR